MGNFTIVNWCAGDPCDPCGGGGCMAFELAGQLDPSDNKKADAIFVGYLLCDPSSLIVGTPGTFFPETGFGNPYYSSLPGSSASRSFAALANNLIGAWDINCIFSGSGDSYSTTVFTEQTQIHYNNIGHPEGGPWELVSASTSSPAPKPVGAVTGWTVAGPIDPAEPPYTWHFEVTGSYQQIAGSPDPAIGASVYTVIQQFTNPPNLFYFQGTCPEHDVYRVAITDSYNVTYPMAASYAAAAAELGRNPSRCRPTAMGIFVPGSGTFYPTKNPDGSLTPPALPTTLVFSIGPYQFTITNPFNTNPGEAYTETNPCIWPVYGDNGNMGSGATQYYEDLVTTDLTTTTDDPRWSLPWPDFISWFGAQLSPAALRRSTMGHRLPLIRRFQIAARS